MSQTPPEQDIDYALSTRRLYWLTLAIGVAGSVLGAIIWNGRAGAGFALGSLASLGNLWVWESIALAAGGAQNRRTMAAAGFFAGRLLALFAFGYVIVKALNIQPLPAILGLFASSAAVLLEILIELAGSWRLSR